MNYSENIYLPVPLRLPPDNNSSVVGELFPPITKLEKIEPVRLLNFLG